MRGIQSQGVGASVKHYAANSQETDRLRVDARVDERTLREVYLPAFERVVREAAPWTVMCAYNRVNGTHATEHAWLLGTVLRGEFGFRGLVVSDWGAVHDRVPALLAGTDLEMPPDLPRSPDRVVAAVRAGRLDLAVLDRRVRTVLELVDRGAPVSGLDEGFGADAHHRLAREAAAASVVLLVNAPGRDGRPVLPLPGGGRIAVIGELARTPRYQGAGSSQVDPTRLETVLEELCRTHPDLTFAPGYRLDGRSDDRLRSEAVAAAAATETVVLVLGLPAADESEGFDRTHLDLPADQLRLLAAVAEANPDVVAVVVNGGVVRLGVVARHAHGVLEAWLGGQAAGGGVADVLTGAVNPSGRLAETVPHRLEDTPSYLHFPGDAGVVRYGEGVFVGYRGHDAVGGEVAFPFGFGLSYTSFALSDLEVTVTGSVAGGDLAVDVTTRVRNTGAVAGRHVVQVYVRDPVAAAARPVRELRGFAGVTLGPGEARTVRLTLTERAFAYWSPAHRRWVVEAGEFVVEAGHHSRDLPLRATIDLPAPSLAAPITPDSTLYEWLADPVARALLAEEAAAGGPDPGHDPDLPVVGSMPMSTLAAFGGMSFDHDTLDRLATAWRERTGG